MNKFLRAFSIAFTMFVGANLMVSCDNDPLTVGDELVGGGATGSKVEMDVLAYNETSDTILSNQRVLQNAILGNYSEPVFGKNAAKFYTQVRLSTTSPSFGGNPVVDSVVLRIPVYYKTTALKTDTVIVKPAESVTDKKDTLFIHTKYAVDSIYGNKDTKMKLNVREINTVLFYDTMYYSKPIRSRDQISVLPNILGSTEISKEVTTVTKKLDGETTNIFEEAVAYKIVLDKQFFEDKIIKNRGTGNLSDNSTFLRNVLRGLEFSVEDENGFYFQFKPNSIDLKMYYEYDNTSTATDAPKRSKNSYSFDFTNYWSTTTGYAVQINQFEQERTPAFANAVTNPDRTNGAEKLYLNGMDGTQINVLFKQDKLTEFKDQLAANNWIIIGAKLVFNADETYPFSQKPPFLAAWNHYNKESKWTDELYSDLTSSFYNAYPSSVHFNPMYDYTKNNGQYTINITDHFKNMIEKNETFDQQKMIVSMGNFLITTGGTTIASANPYSNSRVSSPYRLVFHGSESPNLDKKLKLLIYYTKK